MKYILLLVIVFTASSCQFFETQKISSDTFYEEEIKTIDWSEVDTYPQFISCTGFTEKEATKQCFINTLNNEILAFISPQKLISRQEINTKIVLHINVSETGKLGLETIAMDSIITKQFPGLKSTFQKVFDSIPPSLPALKRGIPVKTKFSLPVILKTE